MSFRFEPFEIPEVILIEARAFEDERGFFMETFKQSEFIAGGMPQVFVQDNYSHSVKNVLRGLHYQKSPHAQGKLVFVISGEIFDVMVDIRKGSPTFGKWAGAVLSSKNRRMLYVPEGFAHGFCVQSDRADVVYKVTREYAPEHDRGIVWNDPSIGVKWPTDRPVLSAKDARLPLLSDADNNFTHAGRSGP